MSKIQNTKDLREFLLERMEALVDGKETPAKTNSVARLAAQVNTTLALDLLAERQLRQNTQPTPLGLK